MADHGLAALRRDDPGPVDPRRVVAHMLMVAAGEFGDPVAGGVLVEAGDVLLQKLNDCVERARRLRRVRSRTNKLDSG